MLSPLKPREDSREFVGFDLELADNNQTFVCAAFTDGGFFWEREQAVEHALSQQGKILCATNLPFDFFALFGKSAKGFQMLWNGTRLLHAETWVDDGKPRAFAPEAHSVGSKVSFWDTMNFVPFSVEKWGGILKKPKLPHPAAFARKPDTEGEKRELAAYCFRDAEISREALLLLKDGYHQLGGSMKFTGASTAMSIWRTAHLKDSYWTPDAETAREHFAAYAGGRCEAFARGRVEGAYFYDVNSLYPFVMSNNAFPDPNHMRVSNGWDSVIWEYLGISDVTLEIPPCRYPMLFQKGERLLFPTGKLSGWFTHAEIMEAIKRGATLLSVRKSFYSKQEVRPFDTYVNDVYAQRLLWQSEKNPLELVAKLAMNSLAGKFGQKFDDRSNLIPCDSLSFKQLNALSSCERIGDFFSIKQNCRPAAFCLPLWASSITAYARLELQKHLEASNALYCDTDSIVTFRKMPTSTALGKLKEECRIIDGIIVRPKFYGFVTDQGERVKCKGYGARMTFPVFEGIIAGNKAVYRKAVKIRESCRRNLLLNAFIDVEKCFSIEDVKRRWSAPFSPHTLEWSEPLFIPAQNIEPVEDATGRSISRATFATSD